MCVGDFNGHVGRHIHGFDVAHDWYGVGERNLEIRRLLEFYMEMELCVSDTWLK